MNRLFVSLLVFSICLTPATVTLTSQPGWAQIQDIKTLIQQAIQYTQQGKPQQAIETLQKVLRLAQQTGDKVSEATVYLGLGLNYHNIGKTQLALVQYAKALLIFQEIKERKGEADTINNIGSVYNSLGKSEEALKFLNQALLIRKDIGDRSGEAATLNNIGAVYRNIGQPEQALNSYNQALFIRREISTLTEGEIHKISRRGEATILTNIGLVYDDIGQPKQALKFYNQALLIRRELGDRSGEAATLNNIGGVYDEIGQIEQALEFYNQSLLILREVGDRNKEATILNNIGLVYRNIGQTEQALKFYNQALPILREVGDHSGEASTLNNIGVVYYNIGQPTQALEFYNQALLIRKKLSTTEDKQSTSSEKAITLNNIGFVYRDTNQLAKAIVNWEESIKITLETRKGLGRSNRKQFIEAKSFTAIALIELLIKQNQAQKAYEWANLVTTFDLADYTRLINAKVSNPEAQREINQWNKINQQLTFLQNQQHENNQQGKYSTELAQRINAIQAQANQKAEDMSRRFPEVAELFETNPTDIKKLQKNLPQNTVVIQPFLLTGIQNIPNTIAIFVLTKDNLTVIQKPLSDDFNQTLSQFRKQLESRTLLSGYTETGGKLYDLFIRPVEEKFPIPSGYQIAIIATGKLRNIPFEPLYDGQADKFLLEKYPVSYLTRLSKTQNRISKVQNQKQSLTALAIANPKPTQQELTGTEAEADYIIQNFPGSEDYRHEQATLDKFKDKAQGFPILHLGTHGCFDQKGCCLREKLEDCPPNQPDMKANTILFANNQQYPIADAALLGLTNTELLVLSACQTAQISDDLQDVGLSGLAYIWERAGAKSTIASLWSAADVESSEIMTKFYANLKQGMSKAEAMRQAKLKLIDKHPFFWSPFILIGDAQ